MTVADFKAHLDINLTGNFIIARAAALYMQDHDGGTIINMSSELSHMGMGHYVHYCAAKAGVVGLTQALAAEMAPKVRVNSISPGPIDTPMLEAEIQWFGGTKEVREGAVNRVPLKRFASPVEVASAVLFLAADAPYATGSTLRLDGGTTAV
jgi:NAD(P)-dependent dehydrogenase (short-subunit alcohol dehydrogenase family)